jgi:hypothetical protein
LAHNSRWQEEWTEYCGDHQDALHEAHDKFNAGDGPPGTTLYQGKKTTWDIDFIAMTQTNPKTKTVRVIALEEQVPVDLTYVDAGPARLPYKPAWNLDTDPIAPSKASLILCNLPCEFSIFNVENRSSHRCGERCKLPHQHYGACNCNGHTALQDLQAFASKSDEVLLKAPPPPPDPLDRSGSWDAMQKFKELREEREASGTWESAQEVHSPSPESDPDVGWSYDRSTQEWTPPSAAIRTLAGATIVALKNGPLPRAAIRTVIKPSKRAKVRIHAPVVRHILQMTITGVHGREMRQPRLRNQVLKNKVHLHHGAISIMVLQPRQMRTPT